MVMHADEDGLEGSPWYVRAFVRVGVPTAFAGLLLWFLLTNVTGNVQSVSAMQLKLAENDGQIIATQQRIIEMLITADRERRTQSEVIEAICFNLSRTELDRQRCADATILPRK